MSKKRVTVTGAWTLAAIALVAVPFLASCKAASPNTQNAGTQSPTQASGTTTASGGSTTGSLTSSSTTPQYPSGQTSSGNNAKGGIKVYPPLPNPNLPPKAPKAAAPVGATLAPLTESPANTIAAVQIGKIPEGSAYSIVMKPYGIGPPNSFGSRIAIRIVSVKPIGRAPSFAPLKNANVLVVADTTNGGSVTRGGTYAATLTFLSDHSQLLPVLSTAKAQ